MASQNTDQPENLRKIFLGGLNRSTTKDDLKAHFEQFGKVIDSVVIRNADKESKGFGFVTMQTIEETDKSLRENNSGLHEINKKKVEVKRAIPRESNIPPDPTNQVFVKNLGTVVTEDQLREYFGQFSTVKSVKVIKERGGEKKSRGFGFVEFEDAFAHHAVDKIAIMEKHPLEGRTIYCSKAEDRSNKDDFYGRYQGMRGGYMNRNAGRGGGYGYSDGYTGGYCGTGNYGGGRGGYGGGGYGGNPYGSHYNSGGNSYGNYPGSGGGYHSGGNSGYGGYGGSGYGGGGGYGYGGHRGY